MKGFLMTIEIAEKFYKLCAASNATTLEQRLVIMSKLLHEENIKIMKETDVIDTIKKHNVITIHNKNDK